MKHFIVVLIVLLTLVPSITRAQVEPVPQLTNFIRANETFGRRLLAELDAAGLEKNVVVSPLGVSISFAPIRYASSDYESLGEIDKVLGWDAQGLDVSSRMLLARFDDDNAKISTRFLFRKNTPISDDFLRVIGKDFGVELQAVDPTATQQHFLPKGQDPPYVSPQVRGQSTNSFWLVNNVVLDSMWTGNTFVMGKTKLDPFTIRSGATKPASMLISELSTYGHVKTPELEAIRLNCRDVYVLLVLPGQDKDIRVLEKSLVGGQALVTGNLPKEIGDVELPEFHLQYDVDLRPTLEAMGMRRVFTDIGSLHRLSAQGAVLQGFWQKVDFTLDKEGIHAHAFTLARGIVGGVLGVASSPFHMVLNRPFLFLIHDIQTDSLLFIGVVVDPTERELGK